MMSSMSYNPEPEYFARSLTKRLERIGSKTSPPIDVSDGRRRHADESIFVIEGETKEERLRNLLENGIRTYDGYVVKVPTAAFPMPGTTFPPNRFASSDVLRAKFQQESKSHFLRQLHKNNHQMVQDIELRSRTEPMSIPQETDGCDSDLFFDFDIGSPEKPETDDPVRIINSVDEMDLDHTSGTDSDASGNSPTIHGKVTNGLFCGHSLSSPEASTAYGSTSSGLFSDPDTPSPTDNEENSGLDDMEGQSLYPEDWLKCQNLAKDDKTPTLSPIASSSDLTNGSSGCGSPNGTNGSSDCESPNEDHDMSQHEESGTDTEDLKVCIGTSEKSVAHSKLQALLAQLDQNNEFRPTPTVTPAPEQNSTPVEIHCNNNMRSRDVTKLASTSPANFSYLVGSVPNQSDCQRPPRVPKSFSTVEMTEFERANLIAKSEESLNSVAPVKIDVDMDETKDKYRKCSSLRSGKTPPCTPGRRKIVRFADVFGLDLADVKTFLDEIPKVPKSAFKDLKDADISDLESDSGSELQFTVQPPSGPPALPSGPVQSAPTIAPLFNQPCGSSDFFNHLRDRKVCLESAYMSDMKNIKGTVRVVNLDFNKHVVIRYTMDEWQTTADLNATYMQGSCDGFSDKFTFVLDYSQISGMVGKRLQFCLKFECSGYEYWDNNAGRNYIFQIFGPAASRSVFPNSVAPTAPFGAANAAFGSGCGASTYSSKGLGRRGSPRKRSPPIAAQQPVSQTTSNSGNHFSTFSHSPSASDDPWLRYL